MRMVKYRQSANAWVVSINTHLAQQAQIKHNETCIISYDAELRALVVRGTGEIEEPIRRKKRGRRTSRSKQGRDVTVPQSEQSGGPTGIQEVSSLFGEEEVS